MKVRECSVKRVLPRVVFCSVWSVSAWLISLRALAPPPIDDSRGAHSFPTVVPSADRRRSGLTYRGSGATKVRISLAGHVPRRLSNQAEVKQVV